MREAFGDISVINLDPRLRDRNGSFRVSELCSGHAFCVIVLDFVRRAMQARAKFLFERGPNLSSRADQRHQPDSQWIAQPLVANAVDLVTRDTNVSRGVTWRPRTVSRDPSAELAICLPHARGEESSGGWCGESLKRCNLSRANETGHRHREGGKWKIKYVKQRRRYIFLPTRL